MTNDGLIKMCPKVTKTGAQVMQSLTNFFLFSRAIVVCGILTEFNLEFGAATSYIIHIAATGYWTFITE